MVVLYVICFLYNFFFAVWNCERTDASLKITSVIAKITSFWCRKNESFSIRLLKNFEISVLPLPLPRMERWHVRNCIYALCNGICVWMVSNKLVGLCFYVLCLFRDRMTERERWVEVWLVGLFFVATELHYEDLGKCLCSKKAHSCVYRPIKYILE